MEAWTEQARKAIETRWALAPKWKKKSKEQPQKPKGSSWFAIEKEIDGEKVWLKRAEADCFVWTRKQELSMGFESEAEARRFIRDQQIGPTGKLIRGRILCFHRLKEESEEKMIRIVQIRMNGEENGSDEKEAIHPEAGA